MIREHEPVTIAGVTYPSHYKAALALSQQTAITPGGRSPRSKRCARPGG